MKLETSMAKSLGANIPVTQSVDSVASIASSIPLECFNNTSNEKLASLVRSMDLNNMDPFRKGFIANQVFSISFLSFLIDLKYYYFKIASSKNASVIKNLLTGTTDSFIINSIPTYLLSKINLNISAIPATNLPKAFVIFIIFNI